MNIQIMLSHILQAIIEAPIWILLLLKITAVLGLAWLVHLALFGANPRWRVLLWRMTAAGLIALPAIVWLFPAMQIRFIPSPENKITANQRGSSQNTHLTNPPLAESLNSNPTGEAGKRLLRTESRQFAYDQSGIDAIDPSRAGAHQFTSPQSTPASYRAFPISLQNMFLAVWLGGVFVLAMRACIGQYRIWQIARRAEQSPESLRAECGRVANSIGCATHVEIVQSEKIRSPLLCGLWRPLLLLPARMCEDTYRGDLPGIFAHELTHVRCHDLFWNAGLHIISILLWFHPLAWRLRKAHLTACELVCDAVSAGFVGDVSEYCRTLARVAVDVFSSHPAAGIAMARLSTISRRLEKLKKGIPPLPLRRRRIIGFGITALLAIVILGVLQFAFAAPSAVEPATVNEAAKKPEDKRMTALEKADASAKTATMRVRVLDENGKPISDAKITAQVRGKEKEYAFSTDVDGKAVVAVPEKDLNGFWLRIHAEGHVPIMWWNRLKDKKLPPETTFTMEPAQTVGGVVRDEQGNPIEGVRVDLSRRAESGGLNGLDPYSKTDSQGRWTYKYAPKSLGDISYTLSHPEYIDEGLMNPSAMVQRQMQEGTAVMVMKRGTAVSGTVTGPDGKPIENALVVQGADRYTSLAAQPTRTDKDGHYRLILVSSRNNVLTVVWPGLAPALRQIDERKKMDAVDFQLDRGNTIKVRVVDKDNKPVTGAEVSPDSWRGFRTLPDIGITGKTDKEGRWSWTWAPNETVEMSVSKSGYMHIGNLKLAPQEDEYTVTLKQPLTITGKVTDAQTGQPVPNIRIIAGYVMGGDNPNRDVAWQRHEVLESNDGQYKVVVTSPSKGHFVRIEAEGYNPGVSREFKSDEGDVNYDFALNKGGNLDVKVLLPDGKPAAGADVQICPVPPGKFYNMGTFIKNGKFLYADSSSQRLKVAADGLLSIASQEGEFMLVLLHDQGFAKTTSQEVKAKPEINLEAWGRLEGSVRQGTKPLPNVKLDVDEGGQYDPKWSFLNFQDQIETDAEGKFNFPKLLPGKWSVRVLPSNKPEITALFPRPKLVELVAGQTTSVTLGGAGGPVIGKIEWPDGKAPAGDLSKIGASLCTKLPERPTPPKEVIAQGPDAYRQWMNNWEGTDEGKTWIKAAQNAGCGAGVQIGPDGSFRFEGVMPGKYELKVSLVKADADNLPWEFPETLRYTADCTVPEIPGGVSDEPIAIGVVQLKDLSSKQPPRGPVNAPAPQAPGEKTVGTMIDHLELLRYVVATNRENTQKIHTWQGEANVECRSTSIHSGTTTGIAYSGTVQFVFDRSQKSLRWNNTLNKYSRINGSVDDPQPAPQILNGMQTPEALYRYGYYGSPGNPAGQKMSLWIYSFPQERINQNQFDFNPLYYLGTDRGEVSHDISGYLNIRDQPGITGIKIVREGDNVTIDLSLREITQSYTVSLSQGCNPISFETKYSGSTWEYHWTYENVEGIWLPKTWTKSEHQKDQSDEERKVTFVENLLNRPVDAGAFSISSLGIHPGDEVQDRRTDPPRKYNYEGEK